MSSNVLDQIKEMAISRAIGVTKWRTFWIFFY